MGIKIKLALTLMLISMCSAFSVKAQVYHEEESI